MLSNFLVCINAVIPLFILLVIGYLVRRTGLLKDEEVHRFNHMVFLVFFPPLMFQNLYGNNDGFLPDGKLLLFAVPFILCVILLSIPLVKKIEKNPRSQGAMIQAVYRSNFILMGLPVAINIFGKGNVSQTALLIAVIVPMYNVVSVIILESFRGSKPDIGQILKKVATNPIILGAVAGILAILLGSLGIHKFYLGYTSTGIIMLLVTLLTFGLGAVVMAVISLVEGIIYLTKSDYEFYQTYELGQKRWF